MTFAAPRRRPADSGSAVVEFVGVLALLLLLFLVIFQLGIVLHIRNVMAAAAADGARYAANADRTEADGVDRAREAIATGLSDELAQRMTVTAVPSRDDPGIVEVTISGPAPLFVPKLSPFHITVRGHALEESR
ncbi:MAG: pilus assembly protein [Frankiaceae bacterium]|nr:pilus assembly protein [Frankiaceae bacterium]